jgi:DNA-binding NarL/FixJ family response regulator
MKIINLSIIDDHPAIAKGLASELSAIGNYNILFTVSEKEQLIPNLQTHIPDILLMDVVMPNTNGIEAFNEVLNYFPEVKLIAYTGLNNPILVKLLLSAGVKAYVNKESPLSELIKAITVVYDGGIYLPEAYDSILAKYQKENEHSELSKREVEILILIAEGKKTSEIAEQLYISINTVETHRKNIFQKLQVSNAAELIKVAIGLGYVK